MAREEEEEEEEEEEAYYGDVDDFGAEVLVLFFVCLG